MKNVQNLRIWANIGRDIQRILKATQNRNFKFVRFLWHKFLSLLLKPNGSCFIVLSFWFFCLRKENMDSFEWIHANWGCKLPPNDANLGWNHDKIVQISLNFGKRPNLCKSEGSQGLRQAAKLSGNAPRQHLTLSDFLARLGYTWRASTINVMLWALWFALIWPVSIFRSYFLVWDFQAKFAWIHSRESIFSFLSQKSKWK